MKISAQLVVGLALTLVSAYYWGTFAHSPLNVVPVIYRYTFRLYPYLDLMITFVGMLLFYWGLKKLRR